MDFDSRVTQQYQGEEGKTYHYRVSLVPDRAYPWVAHLRRDKIAPFINEQDTILEYGVGPGWNLAALECRSRIGYDIGDLFEDLLKEKGIESTQDIDTIPSESIDVVICHHVLEHTSSPPAVLKEIMRLLCIGGRLLLFVPYEKERKHRRYDPHEPNSHLYSWTVQTLGNLVDRIGFKVIDGSIERFGYHRFSGVWADRLNIGEAGFRLLRRAIHLVKPGFEVFLVAQKQ